MDEFEILKQKQAEIKRLQVQAKTMVPDKKKKRKKRSGGSSGLQNFTVPKRKLKLQTKSKAEIEKWEKENNYQVAAPVAIQLELFHHDDYFEEKAAMPNTIARSALFAPIARGRRKYVEDIMIASRSDVSIKYTGQQLDIGDADVFMQTIRLADQSPLGTEFQILPFQFLREIGRKGTGIANKQWLIKSFKRLKTGVVTIETDKYIVMLSLIDEYIYDKDNDTHQLRLNPKIVSLFRREQYGLIDWDKRKAITQSVGLSKWLQTYVASNKKGDQCISIKKIQAWCGKEKMRADKFKTALNKALAELERLNIIKNSAINNKGILKYERL